MRKILFQSLLLFFFAVVSLFLAGKMSKAFAVNNARCDSITVPTDSTRLRGNPTGTVVVGEQYTATISFRNTSNTTWVWNSDGSGTNKFRIGSQDPQDNQNWGFGRIELGRDVPPGDTLTVTVTATAPSTYGGYNFDWQMLQEGVEWFGTACNGGSVDVRAKPTGNIRFDGPASGTVSYDANARTITMNVGDTLPNGAIFATGQSNQPGKFLGMAMVLTKKDQYQNAPDFAFTFLCGAVNTTLDQTRLGIWPGPTAGRYCFMSPYVRIAGFGNSADGWSSNAWTPTEPGTYWAIVDVRNEYELKCTGKPYGGPYPGWEWAATPGSVPTIVYPCGTQQSLTIIVKPAATLKIGAGPSAVATNPNVTFGAAFLSNCPSGSCLSVGKSRADAGGGLLNPLIIQQDVPQTTGTNKKTVFFYDSKYGKTVYNSPSAPLRDATSIKAVLLSDPRAGFVLTFNQNGSADSNNWTYTVYNPCSGGQDVSLGPNVNIVDIIIPCTGITVRLDTTQTTVGTIRWRVTFAPSFGASGTKTLLSGSEVESSGLTSPQILTPSAL